jgi:glycosyltransferase involved in cell wall biosynthesis
MRILIHDFAGHPFQVQLSRYLAGCGYEVLHLYAGSNQTPHGDLVKRVSDPSKFAIHAISIKGTYQKQNFLKRWAQEREYGELLANEIERFRPDVMFSANTPLDAQYLAYRRCKKVHCKFIFWLQDLTGYATYLILRKKMPGIGHLIGRYYLSLENKILRHCQHVVSISQDFLPYFSKAGVSPEHISVIQNWMPLEDIVPCDQSNPWAISHGYSDKFVFLYSGAMGMKHNPQVLCELADYFKNDQDVRVNVISEGIGASWLTKEKEIRGLQNMNILPYQPYETISQVLGSGDVLVAMLEADAGVISVPSKILSYACAGRPILFSVPEKNLAARIVKENEMGLIVPPDDTASFLKAAKDLYDHPELRQTYAKNARRYAEMNFDIRQIGAKFINIIHEN